MLSVTSVAGFQPSSERVTLFDKDKPQDENVRRVRTSALLTCSGTGEILAQLLRQFSATDLTEYTDTFE